MKRLLRLYLQFFIFHLKSKLSYRFNVIMLLFYGPAYVVALMMIIQLIYQQTSQLLGWTQPEALFLFSTFHLIYSICIMLFIDGLRQFLWSDIRTGALDIYLTKPINPQFLIAFSRPGLDQLLLFTGLLIFFCSHIMNNHQLITLPNLLFYLASLPLAISIIYLTLSTYATLGFYMTRAGQIMELFDKSCDFAQYPPQIFPKVMQFFTFTFIPIALFSYVPTSILLGKISPWYILGMASFVIFLNIINKVCWKEAVKKYSSASS